jgi:hypothetical protein
MMEVATAEDELKEEMLGEFEPSLKSEDDARQSEELKEDPKEDPKEVFNSKRSSFV